MGFKHVEQRTLELDRILSLPLTQDLYHLGVDPKQTKKEEEEEEEGGSVGFRSFN
jgi:hypothetical protein